MARRSCLRADAKQGFKDGVNRETVGCDYDVWLYEIAPVQLREATVNSKRGRIRYES